MTFITEKPRQTEIIRECDVLVVGGGIAGIAAALSATRAGAKVILLERQYILGGLGTSGLITIYLPLCDGMGRQVSFGISEELLRLSIKHGAEADYPKQWLYGGTTEDKKTGSAFWSGIILICSPYLPNNFYLVKMLKLYTAPTHVKSIWTEALSTLLL